MGRLGKTIAITRPAWQSESLRRGLEAYGFDVVECPAIEIVPLDDWRDLDAAIANLPSYDWVLLTSANTVDLFFQRLSFQKARCGVPVVVVGAATADRVRHWNHTPALQPAEEFRSEGILKLFPADLTGTRFLFPRAEAARELLTEELRRRGATVDLIPIYQTRKNKPGIDMLRKRLEGRDVACVVFTSPSAVHYVIEAFGENVNSLFDRVSIAVLGPVAREAVSRAGLAVAIEPDRALQQDLIDAIARYFAGLPEERQNK